jgi:pyruvate dehydrogenase E1 component alpha subunit
VKPNLQKNFGILDFSKYESMTKENLSKAFETMVLCRQFENACNQAYMQGHIRGFLHLDTGEETIPAFVADCIRKDDLKVSYYRSHTHAIASGVPLNSIMAELFAKEGGSCKGMGGSMHLFDKEHSFQGGWALVGEQLPIAVGAARSILLDREKHQQQQDKERPVSTSNLQHDGGGDHNDHGDNRLAVVFVGDGAAQNGRMAECLNAASKESLPLLFVVVDNGRAINTFTPDVASNSDVFGFGQHYGVPGVLVDGQNLETVLKAGRAVVSEKERRLSIFHFFFNFVLMHGFGQVENVFTYLCKLSDTSSQIPRPLQLLFPAPTTTTPTTTMPRLQPRLLPRP